MITRFYVDNYKCLVNFEYKPQPLELIIGANGSGKSTVFEALSALRDLVIGRQSVEECFPISAFTRWRMVHTQRFRLDFEVDDCYRIGDKEELRYEVGIWHDVENKKSHIFSESLLNLTEDGFKHLFHFESGEGQLYGDDNSPGPSFPMDSSRSALATVPTRRDTRRLEEFRQQLAALLVIHLNPMAMDYASEAENSIADRDFSNFASWYRHHSQEHPRESSELAEDLREVLDDFGYLQLTKVGSERRELRMITKGPGDGSFYRFDELSDGQRALIVLYSVLHFAVGKGATVCIDEPENFVALREMQPFILSIEKALEESGPDGQILLISHNQEFINMLTDRGKCTRFYRENNGHTRIAAFNPDSELTAAEIVARGWEDDEQ